MAYGTIGSVSSGTMREIDLIDTFTYELSRLARMAGKDSVTEHKELLDDCAKFLDQWEESDADHPGEAQTASELVEALFDALNEFAPPYTYFGAHEGDGADYGFWPAWNSIEELPSISDPSELPTGEDCKYVNDHGNVSIYDAQGDLIWDCV